MRKFTPILFLSLILCEEAPKARKISQQLKIHNQIRTDNYYWMNQKDDEWVLNYLNQENIYRDKVLNHTKELKNLLYNEMISRIAKNENLPAFTLNEYEFRKIYKEENDYEIYQRRLISDKKSEWMSILDLNEFSKIYNYIDVGWIEPSPNGQYLAFGIDIVGNYRFYIKVINLITGELLNEHIPNTWGKCIWHPENNRFYYSEKDKTNRNSTIKEHWIGFNKSTDDKIIFEEKDEKFSVYLNQSKSKKYMFIGSESTNTTEFSFIDLEKKDLNIVKIMPRKEGHLYYPMIYNDLLYILTNKDHQVENKIITTSISNSSISNWTDFILPDNKHTFEDFIILKDHIICKARHNLNPYFHITNLKTDSTYTLDFDHELYYLDFKDNYNLNSKYFRFEISSPITPEIIYDYDLEENELITKYKRRLNKTYNFNKYKIERHYVPDRDNNVKIPLTLIFHKDFNLKNSQNPALIYGYGAYGSITDSYFVNSYISLLDRGVIIALAHVRGSGDLGRQWYIDGKMFQKMNSFTDFIDCTKYLLENNYTSSDKLFAQGTSAGGLLMGTVANLEPNLYKGMLIEVPFMDVITTMSDASIPLTTQEYEEWGDPKIRDYFDYMMKYSPYDNIEKKNYPSMFVTASYNDSQVGYWEPAKYVAKMREFKTDNNPIILSTDMTGSHSGPSGRYSGYELIALEYAFLLDQVGFIHQGSRTK